MARGFTADEREVIKHQLVEKGKELFQQYGFQKTSITQITEAVGIAQGTFYNFYDSKEALYFFILELEEAIIRKQLLNVTYDSNDSPQKVLKQLFEKILHLGEINPLIKELYVGNQLAQLKQRLSAEEIEEHIAHDTNVFESIVDKWKTIGIPITVSPEVVAGIFRSLFILTMETEAIGEEVYRETIDFLLMSVTNELVNQNN